MPAEATRLRERQRREREELIVAEAGRLIDEAGYADFVMERLADRVGVAKGTLYLYFPTKEDLLVAVMVRGMTKFNERLQEIRLRDDLSARDRLIFVGNAVSGGHSAWTRIMQGSETSELSQVLARHAELGEHLEQTVRCVAELVEEAQRSGDFVPGVSPVAAAAAVFVLMASHTRFSAMLPSSLRPSPLELLDVLFTGLLPPPATR